ncbi:hypothetical protein N310_13896, partial [Acanthisitta chloris]
HPALPQRKTLPHVRVLGVRPAKPQRPPGVDLAKPGATAHPGMPIKPAMEPPRTAQLAPCAAAAVPNQSLPRRRDGDEIYDDVESAEPPRRSPGLLLPPVSRPPVSPHPKRG